jgi:glutamate-1-semialdehyde 2,1-aminomutase
MIKRGVLFQGIVVPTISHDENELNFFLSAFEDSLIVYREAIENGTENYLIGKAIKPVFRKYI